MLLETYVICLGMSTSSGDPASHPAASRKFSSWGRRILSNWARAPGPKTYGVVKRMAERRFKYQANVGKAQADMPTVTGLGKYRLFFFNNEGTERKHMHVASNGNHAKFWLDPIDSKSPSEFAQILHP